MAEPRLSSPDQSPALEPSSLCESHRLLAGATHSRLDRLLVRVACWILSAAIIAVAIGHQARRISSVHHQGRWYFPDTDDYLRLFRVRLILDGRATIVRHIAELNPPQGVTLHWTAPMDYLLIGATKLWGELFGAADALENAAAWTPVLLGGVYLALIIW